MDEHRIREIVREEAQVMRDAEIRDVVKATLREIGLQPDDPESAQDQAAMIRSLHRVFRTGRKAVVYAIAVAFVGGIIEGFRRLITGG